MTLTEQQSALHDLTKLLVEDMKTIYNMGMYVAQIKNEDGVIAQLIAEMFHVEAASHTMINSVVQGTKNLRDNGLTTEEIATVFAMRVAKATKSDDLVKLLEYGAKK